MTLLALLIFSFFAGVGVTLIFHKIRLASYHHIAHTIIHEAEKKAILLKENALKTLKEEEYAHKLATTKQMTKLQAKQEQENERAQNLEKKTQELAKKEKQLHEKEESLRQKQQTIAKEEERLSGLTRKQARDLAVEEAKNTAHKEISDFLKKAHQEAEETAEQEALRLIQLALSRLCLKQLPEHSLALLPIADEMKARIIGREGRNIRTLEEKLGVTLHIDNSSSFVAISTFDAERRYLAKCVLEELIQDGRITPQAIEDLIKKHESNISNVYLESGKKAAEELSILNLHPELLTLLGKLKFRSSLGQNVLEHSVEVALLMGSIASELGLDVKKARRIGLLHDIGKALPSEDMHSHAISGMLFAKKYGESIDVANGIGCHHDELSPTSCEAMLIKPCDTLSASRTYARRSTQDEYFKKQEAIEQIAKNMQGVHSAYAIQGGKEVRVFVMPDLISEQESEKLAKQIAEKIESEKILPYSVRVTVVREKTTTAKV